MEFLVRLEVPDREERDTRIPFSLEMEEPSEELVADRILLVDLLQPESTMLLVSIASTM